MIYFVYGIRHSNLNNEDEDEQLLVKVGSNDEKSKQ